MTLAAAALINFLVWLSLNSWSDFPIRSFPAPDASWLLLAACCGNLAVMLIIRSVRHRVVQPWQHIRSIVRHTSMALSEDRDAETIGALSVRDMALSLSRFASHAQNAYAKCRALQHELEESRQMMEQITRQHQIAMQSTNRELGTQYRSVLAYANYLDEHIRRHKSDAQLRYDFDDVCESGFNLKLIAQSLELLRQSSRRIAPVPLSLLLQRTVIALAPTLERRVMKLSTDGVDETVAAETDTGLLSHALWMLLLGTIRYAAEESTLQLRCFATAEGNAVISIGISEMEPGQLSPEERQAHMVRQLQHMTPHMFAETIRLHANAQLAGLLLSQAGGTLSVLPINTHACEIAIVLPAAKK